MRWNQPGGNIKNASSETRQGDEDVVGLSPTSDRSWKSDPVLSAWSAGRLFTVQVPRVELTNGPAKSAEGLYEVTAGCAGGPATGKPSCRDSLNNHRG